MQVTYTSDAPSQGVNILIHGESGAGKTYSLRTIPDLMIISVEGGTLSLADCKIPVLEARSIADLNEALNAARTWDRFPNIAVDSISEVSELVLSEYLRTQGHSDPRAAYGNMQIFVRDYIKAMHNIPGKNTVMTAKTGIAEGFDGTSTFGPIAAGKKMTTDLPYEFDIVMCLRMWREQDNTTVRKFQTQADGQFTAKARAGHVLLPLEDVDLGSIINRLSAGTPAPQPEPTFQEPAQ